MKAGRSGDGGSIRFLGSRVTMRGLATAVRRLTGRERGHRLPPVKPAKAKTLGELLTGKPPGAWVVINPGMTEVMAVAATPEQAMLDAGYTNEPSPDDDTDSLPVMAQVPEPGLKLY